MRTCAEATWHVLSSWWKPSNYAANMDDNNDKVKSVYELARQFVLAAREKIEEEVGQTTSQSSSQSANSVNGRNAGFSCRPISVSIANTMPSSFGQRVAANFRSSFPGLSSTSVKHKELRTSITKNPHQKKAFFPYEVKESWTHEFCCIPYTFSRETPSSNVMSLLKASGLGKTKVCFPNKKAKHAEFCQKIEEVFPALSTCGGYTLLKGRGGGTCRPLEKLEVNWFNIEDIKKCIVGTACIYIRPIQRNLDLEMRKQITKSVPGPDLTCLECLKSVPSAEMEMHMKKCKDMKGKVEDQNDAEGCAICLHSLGYGELLAATDSCNCLFHQVCLSQWQRVHHGEKDCPKCHAKFLDVIFLTDLTGASCETQVTGEKSNLATRPNVDTQETAVRPDEFNDCSSSVSSKDKPSTLAEALQRKLVDECQKRQTDIKREGEIDDEYNEHVCINMHVRRTQFWPDLCAQIEDMDEEDWKPKIRVVFVGEAGVDTGGLMREFYSLLYKSVQGPLMRGQSPYLTFTHDQTALNKRMYELFGKLVAIGILNGLPGPNYLAEVLARHILEHELLEDCDAISKELPGDTEQAVALKEKLEALSKSKDQSACNKMFDDLEERFDFGYTAMSLDKVALFQAAGKHFIVSSCFEEIESFKAGLMTFDVLPILKAYKKEALLVFTEQELSVKDMEEMFSAKLGLPGCNERAKEETVLFNWFSFLKSCKKGKISRNVISLQSIESRVEVDDQEIIATVGSNTTPGDTRVLFLNDVLQFITGSYHKPAVGTRGYIEFDHSADESSGARIVANTCAATLTVPTTNRYTGSPKEFIANFSDDIFDGPDFGRC